MSLQKLKTAKLAEEDKPEIVSQESIDENGHVNRLWAQEEDLNSIVFQNRDGTKTMYYYAEPVKYTDEKLKTTAKEDAPIYLNQKMVFNKRKNLRKNCLKTQVVPKKHSLCLSLYCFFTDTEKRIFNII